MNFMRPLAAIITAMLFGFAASVGNAAARSEILFVPHDDRPVSFSQTVQVIEAAGYKVLTPPAELLSKSPNEAGDADKLWEWLEENAPKAEAAVISSDSLLYGGLIPSRKHEIPAEKIAERLEKFKELRRLNSYMRIYVFASLMRTPSMGVAGHNEEPEYYVEYGADFFNLTRLTEKKELYGLTGDEEQLLTELDAKIPPEIKTDWFGRRAKNLNNTKKLVDYLKKGSFDYLLVGRDDNAPLCQTHRENRELTAYAEQKKLPRNAFRSLAGIDEFNLLLLNRAVNDLAHEIPFVCVRYNRGPGGDTVPAFSDEKISASVDTALSVAGAMRVSLPRRADFVLLVNTPADGDTTRDMQIYPGDFGFRLDKTEKIDGNTKYFVALTEEYLNEGCPVGIADIKYTNGADNALMKLLQKKDLLFRLQAYAGWNTACNSVGFALGTGMFTPKMSEEAKNELLLVRYLDDWAYQSNVRPTVGRELVQKFGNIERYYNLGKGEELSFAQDRNTEMLRLFAAKNFPNLPYLQKLKVKNPWIRMFECYVEFSK